MKQQVGPDLQQGFQEAQGRQVGLLHPQLVRGGGLPFVSENRGHGVPVPEEEERPGLRTTP